MELKSLTMLLHFFTSCACKRSKNNNNNYKCQSPQQQNLLSPTENSAPEMPCQESFL